MDVIIPRLSALAEAGKTAFDSNRAACHGVTGAGSDQGPPLVHDIDNPGHHADGAFVRAARQGVRELQEASGITYRPHRM